MGVGGILILTGVPFWFSHAYWEEGEGSGIQEPGDRWHQPHGLHNQESEHDAFRWDTVVTSVTLSGETQLSHLWHFQVRHSCHVCDTFRWDSCHICDTFRWDTVVTSITLSGETHLSRLWLFRGRHSCHVCDTSRWDSCRVYWHFQVRYSYHVCDTFRRDTVVARTLSGETQLSHLWHFQVRHSCHSFDTFRWDIVITAMILPGET